MKIGIAGVGGIGSNVAVNLVRAGCNYLKLVDYDLVEESNLNRQFYFHDQIGKSKVEMLYQNLLRLDPHAKLERVALFLTMENITKTFSDCDFIVEGFDNEKMKKLLIETFANHGIPIVSASGIAGSKIETIRVHHLQNCSVVGDFETDFRMANLYSPKITVIAAMMADIVLQRGGYYDEQNN